MYYLFSIIIPSYNSEEYIEKCIQSCLNQNLQSSQYEILVIDDGSTDNSADIIKSLQEVHSHIILIQKNNGGVSSARNLGIKAAKGEYIIFVDSDDTIAENSLGKIFEELNSTSNELLILNSIIFKNLIRIQEAYKFPKHLSEKTLSGKELFNNHYLRGSVCGVVFKKEFLQENQLKFSESVKNGEDTLFMTMCFLYAQKIKHLSLDFYEVDSREGSVARVWDFKKILVMLDSLDVIRIYKNENTFSEIQQAMLNIRAYGIISSAVYYFFSLNELNRYSELKNKIKYSNIYPINTFGANHYRYKILLLNFSFDLFCLPFLFRQILLNIKSFVRISVKKIL